MDEKKCTCKTDFPFPHLIGSKITEDLRCEYCKKKGKERKEKFLKEFDTGDPKFG